jgi:antitoxin CptB
MDDTVSGQSVAVGRARLAWRCRRGMKELDLLLAGWLETRFEQASADLRRQFEGMLELPDPLLALYLLGAERPEQADLAALVACIRGCSNIMSSAVRDGNLPPEPALQVSLVPGGTAYRS